MLDTGFNVAYVFGAFDKERRTTFQVALKVDSRKIDKIEYSTKFYALYIVAMVARRRILYMKE